MEFFDFNSIQYRFKFQCIVYHSHIYVMYNFMKLHPEPDQWMDRRKKGRIDEQMDKDIRMDQQR